MQMNTEPFFFFLLAVWLFWQPAFVTAQSPSLPGERNPLIAPPNQEKKVVEEKIDKEYLELAPFAGIYDVEGFNASPVYGIRASLHMTEDVFFEGNFALTKAEQSEFTRQTGLSLLTNEDIVYWNVNLGYNLFPGQIFLTGTKTLNSTIYLVGGVGQTEFDDQDRFTINFGTGYKIFFTDWMDMGFRLSFHSFESDLTGENKRLINMEGTVHLAVFF